MRFPVLQVHCSSLRHIARARALTLLALSALSAFFAAPHAARASEEVPAWLRNPPVERLRIDGENFRNGKGELVRFWGVNVVALYPQKKQAEGLAASLAACGINLVRPHHYLRPSTDWNPQSKIAALADYDANSYTPTPEALDRFDYLNAELRKRGIYLAFALRYSRNYTLADSKILTTTKEDDLAWRKAMAELNNQPWNKAIDTRKMLPMFDERCQAIDLAFARQLLAHVNPYTGLSYAADPQVLTIECINEFTSEYTIICGAKGRFPKYWEDKLQAKWEAYLKENGGESCSFGDPKTSAQKELRNKFLVKLDADYFAKIKELARSLGSQAALTFSNLWRGESAARLESQLADSVEDHAYINPFFAAQATDATLQLGQQALAGKPFFIGELNQSEGGDNIARQSPFRSQLPFAAAAYGSFQNYSGLVWFAWLHGDRALGDDGRPATGEKRASNIGELMSDATQLDHLRTAGLIFRRALTAPSKSPIIVHADDPVAAHDYHALMAPKYPVKPGWQNIHAVRKAFGPRPADEAAAPWFTQEAPAVLTSDTGEIRKDPARKQLTLAAPQAEGFSGNLDGQPGASLQHLQITGADGFATVLLVAVDSRPLAQSRHLLLSRTSVDKTGNERDGEPLRLQGLQQSGGSWQMRLTRPQELQTFLQDYAKMQTLTLQPDAQGTLTLPTSGWRECELEVFPVGQPASN